MRAVTCCSQKRVSCVVIVQASQWDDSTQTPKLLPIGIITESDVVRFRASGLDLEKTQAQAVMSKPLFCLSLNDSLWVAHQAMESQQVRRLVIVGQQGELMGLITQNDLLQVLDPLEMVSVIAALEDKVEAKTHELQQLNQQLLEEITSRKRIEEALLQSQLDLEHKVSERTSKLIEANKLLHQEIQIRKQAEIKISEQATLLDVATDAIFVQGLDSQILYWNKGAQRLYGWQAEEIIGKSANDTLDKEDSSQLQAAIKITIEYGSWQGELDKVCKDNKDIVVESRWSLVRDELDNPKSILVVDTDITQKKQLQTQLFRAQRLESLGTLASGISHDLNNILTPILAVAQILPIRNPNLDEQSQSLLHMVEDSSKRGSNLVKQILSFARGIEGKRTVIQVQHILSEIIQIARETFPKSIQVWLSIKSKNLCTVLADTTQLHQVLMNLAVNARDAMREGGDLIFEAENVYIDEIFARMHADAKVGHYVVITVSDTGCGISTENIERIFEPFFTTKQDNQGTGLGLSTVLGIIKSHNGFINIYSEVGQGTRFLVYLPATEASLSPAHKNTNSLTGNGELILVVDDESSIREITKITLETHNYAAITASNGVEAIAVFAKLQSSLRVVLLDMMMPLLDTPTTIRTLKRIKPDIKIVAMSGLESNQDIVYSRTDSADEFLLKPFTSEELLQVLQKVYSRCAIVKEY